MADRHVKGTSEALVEMAGGAIPRVEVTAAQWQGAPETVFAIRWS